MLFYCCCYCCFVLTIFLTLIVAHCCLQFHIVVVSLSRQTTPWLFFIVKLYTKRRHKIIKLHVFSFSFLLFFLLGHLNIMCVFVFIHLSHYIVIILIVKQVKGKKKDPKYIFSALTL